MKMPKTNSTKSVFLLLSNADVSNVSTVDVELPPLEQYGVLIRVNACGLTRLPDYGSTFHQLLTNNLKILRIGAGTAIAGVIVETGTEVTSVIQGDHVAGLMPFDYDQSGCSDYVVLQEYDVCLKPTSVSFVDAAGCLDDAVKAYIACHYLARLVPGDTVLVEGGASSYGSICVQLALQWHAKVITTCTSEDEKRYLSSLNLDPSQIIDLSDKTTALKAATMLETGNLGVDVFIDQGVRQRSDIGQGDAADYYPTKHEIISCLSVGGRWVTSTPDLQLDPPESAQLALRCASACFLFEQAWLLSAGRHGKYQHILRDILDRLANKTIRPNVHHTVVYEGVVGALESVNQIRVGRVVMTSLP